MSLMHEATLNNGYMEVDEQTVHISKCYTDVHIYSTAKVFEERLHHDI